MFRIFIYLVFISKFTVSISYAAEILPKNEPCSICVEKYRKKIERLNQVKVTRIKNLKDTINLFVMLDDPQTSLRGIAEPYRKWWESSAFAKQPHPFRYLLAIYKSGVLCQEKYYSINKIATKFPKLIQRPEVRRILEEQKKILANEEKERVILLQLELNKKREISNNLIRTELIERLRESGVQLYSLYKINQEVLQINMDDVSLPQEKEECPICLTTYKELAQQEGKTIRKTTLSCGHSFCTDCIQSHINIGISEHQDHIKCLSKDCSEDLVFNNICDFDLSFEQEQALKKNIVEAEIAARKNYYISCSNKDCAFNFFSGEPFADNGEIKSDICSYCQNKTCLKCHESFLNDHVCSSLILKQKEEDKKIREQGVYMDCPYCGVWHDKDNGCSYVTCTKCKRHYDFATGGPWDTASAQRQKNHNRGYHDASRVDNEALIKDQADFIDGKDKW